MEQERSVIQKEFMHSWHCLDNGFILHTHMGGGQESNQQLNGRKDYAFWNE